MIKKPSKDPHLVRESQKYEYPIASREHILEFLQKKAKPLSFEGIAKAMAIKDEQDLEALRRRLRAMVRDGQLIQAGKGLYRVLLESECVRGRVLAHRDGFGFVALEKGGDDIYLSAREMRALFHGDEVLVRITGLDRRGREEGVVVRVLTRNTLQLAGRLLKEKGSYYLQPDNPRATQRVFIPKEELHGAKIGQVIVVRLDEYPTVRQEAVGSVIEVLGEHMAPGMEIELAMRTHSLSDVWPEEVIAEVKNFGDKVREADKADRKNLTDLAFVTIDGEDAKDFDDAVYCEPLEKGGFRLWVAIADVSHYVKPGSALDREAEHRGNSVYFPEHVIPMLPEILSNELCSLKPKVDRLVVVCDMQIDEQGLITQSSFYDAVIHSKARMTYTEVYALLQGDASVQQRYEHLVPHIFALQSLFHVLLQAREKRGAIDFESSETKIIFGENRKIEKIIPTERNEAHRLIEECMLCANVSAALFLIRKKANALFRVHSGPTGDKLEALRLSLNELALTLEGGAMEIEPADYARLLAKVKDRPDARIINLLLLRSLGQAVYAPVHEGHFGLAYEHYTHFTSPIRRYPDLIVHRLIKVCVHHEKLPVLPDLTALGEHCSMTERRADEATRDVINWLKCEYMMDRLGAEFAGTVASVTHFGLFVELKDVYVEGLVHISSMKDAYYEFDATRHELTSEQGHKKYQLGQAVRVQVARVSLDDRQIDFVLV